MNQKILKVSHLTPHVGGGVGAVIKDFITISSSYSIIHNLFCLDKSETNFNEIVVNGLKMESVLYIKDSSFQDSLSDSDVIFIHYWNHPLLARFLATYKLPICRVIVWCHNSGLFEPHIIPQYLVRMANKVLFTSGCSLRAPNLELCIKFNPEKFGVVHSTHVLDSFLNIGRSRKYKEKLNRLLYVGTVSKSKMHVDSERILKELSSLGFSICVVGGPDHTSLKNKVSSLGGNVDIIGFTKSVEQFYENADIFIYPLRPDHYGTGEQVMLEAMAAGLPIVAFNNPAESEIVSQYETGILANSPDEFVTVTDALRHNFNVYYNMSIASVNRASREFSARIMSEKLIYHINDVMRNEKLKPINHMVASGNPLNGFELFVINSFFDEMFLVDINEMGGCRASCVFNKIKSNINNPQARFPWVAKNKSSPFQYRGFFSDDEELVLLTKMICDEIYLEGK